MKIFAIISERWLALFLIVVFIVIGIATVETLKPAEESKFCWADSDCACGKGKLTGECLYGNKQFVNASGQCQDFCAGVGGDLEIKCVNNQCRQIAKKLQ